MNVEKLDTRHLDECVALLIDTYNRPPWDYHWSPEVARRYLEEFTATPRSVGFVIREDGRIVAAAFCHERTWWTDEELFVDELFVESARQGRGLGTALLRHLEGYARERKLAGITLLTHRNMPAAGFYGANGFSEAGHVVFLYKLT